jgi:hypothetical protein
VTDKLNISFEGEHIFISKPVGIVNVRKELQEQMVQKGTENALSLTPPR